MTKKYEQKNQGEQINFTQEKLHDLKREIIKNKEKSEQNSRSLTEQEFKNEFEGENFQQMDVGNCRMIATIDSFVSYGDFKNLIMNNVRKWNEKGKTFYEIKLPMNSSNAKTYKIFPNAKETHIDGSSKEIINGKSGIVALMLALWEAITGKKNFSFLELDGWFSVNAMKKLLPPDFRLYEGTSKSQSYTTTLRKIFEKFDSTKDLLVLTLGFWGDRKASTSYNLLQTMDGSNNHAFSVEGTDLKNGKLQVILSNPYNSNESFSCDFDDIIKYKPDFTLATKENYGVMNKPDHPQNFKRDKIPTIKEVLKQTDKELTNAEIREISTTPLEYEVSSYGIDTRIKMNGQNITFTINGSSFNISKNNLSKFYKGERNENYPFYLYAMQIANLLNRMQKNFISTKKWWENSEPFSYWILTLWDLRFKFKEDYLPTKVLESWEHLWIGETEDKNKLVNFLNSLYNK